ncbi:MAG: EAL domain-containing protein [Lachnospiraceae bacterium]|nr:EAL domain-containing protein [Lachnospiraceae bacterium]
MLMDYSAKLHETGILIAAFLIVLCCLAYTLIQRRNRKVQNEIFVWLLLIVMLNCACEVVTIFQTPFCTEYLYARIMVAVAMYVYFISHTFLCPLLYSYVLYAGGIINRGEFQKKQFPAANYALFCIAESMVLINPFTDWVYTLDQDYVFHRNWGEYFIYLCAAVYFLLAVSTMLRHWKAIGRRRRIALSGFFLINLCGVFLQMFFKHVRSELFAEALALSIVMLLVENEDERLDMPTKVYNRSALLADMNTLVQLRRSFSVICVRLTNADMLQRLLGTADNDILFRLVSDYLKTVYPEEYLYRPSAESFMLLVQRPQPQVLELAGTIEARFQESFLLQGTELMLEALIMTTQMPGIFSAPEDVLLMSDGPRPFGSKHGLLADHDMDYLIRRAEVESALHRGIAERGFEVYYQPIYRTSGMSIYSAEALLRLKDSRIGNIMPDEFIPIAEQNGLIDRLGDYVLEEVCIFLSSGIPTEMGLECISINLSVLQCLQPDFAGRVLAITRKYEVNPTHINFEITESAAASDYDVLSGVLKELRENGFLFSLDDYGIGYSNVRSIFKLDFDVVKIDKSILWEVQMAEGSQGHGSGHIILENSVRMLREMQLKILVEGVETPEQLELLENMEVDFLQGYYFSRPVSKNELLGILRVTELTRMEEQRARAASEAKSSFLANMSHEIRTPINAILGMNEMILRESKNERILDYAHNIEGAGRTLVSLINDVLDFSKIESGSMEIVESEYDLSSVVNDVVNMISVKAGEKNLHFDIQVDPELPDTLYGDGMRLRQIMVNLLNNAVKYTQRGSVRLEISGRLQEKNTLLLKAVVTDTGIGIKEEDIGRLFHKFTRLDISQNKGIEGSGLGLAITYNLLQLMHGEIEARSTYGKGSTFTVMLPQRISRRDAIGDFRKRYQMNAKERSNYRESFHAPEAAVLVVDDTPVNHTVLKELLKKTGIRIDSAYSGKECIEMIRHTKYDLILLDFRMPEMDGIETLRVMKSLGGHENMSTPVVALTANAVAGARENFLKEGFDDYMIKPVEGGKLEELLIHYLPSEKIHIATAPEDVPGESRGTEAGEKAHFLEQLDDLDVSKGLKNCGSEEGYFSVLKIYYEGIGPKAAEIRKHYEAQDWPAYTIQVHALKSSSRVIGATALADVAAALEEAGNQEDTEKILAETETLLARYLHYQAVLAGIFEEDSALETSDEDADLPEISPAMLNEAYEMMKDFAKLYDYDNMVYVLDSMKEYRIPEEDQVKLRQLRAWTEEFRWEQILECLQ